MLREGRAPVWDRLLTMIFLVALLHGLIILGVTFKAAASDKGAPGLEVLLVSDELPEADKNPNATYLAQRTQVGAVIGGSFGASPCIILTRPACAAR